MHGDGSNERGKIILSRYLGACMRLQEHRGDPIIGSQHNKALSDVRDFLLGGGEYVLPDFRGAVSIAQAIAAEFGRQDDTESYHITALSPNQHRLFFVRRIRPENPFLDSCYSKQFMLNLRSYVRSARAVNLFPTVSDFNWEIGHDINQRYLVYLNVGPRRYDLINYAYEAVGVYNREHDLGWMLDCADRSQAAGMVTLVVGNTREPA